MQCPVSSFSPNHFTVLLQISGEWYTILWGSEDREMIEENGSMRLFLEYIQVLDNSSVLFKFHKK